MSKACSLCVTVAVAAFAAAVSSCQSVITDRWYFEVNVTVEGNGTATATPALAMPGETVTLTATPEAGHLFDVWTVTGRAVELTRVGDDRATFVMPSFNVEITAMFSIDLEKVFSRALYHEGVGAWIVPQNDPYDLENFRAASRSLATRGINIDGWNNHDVGWLGVQELTATHYALRIFPKNEAEQWAVEMLPDVTVSYIPFDYVGLTEAEAQAIDPANKGTFDQQNPHVVVYDGMRTVEGGDGEAVTQRMPILYAVWPVGKPMPAMDHEIDYEIFLPDAQARTRGGEGMCELEREAIRLALGRPVTRAESPATRAVGTLSGDFWVWDALKAVRVPVPRIKLRFYLGSNIVETEADAAGAFSITADPIPADASWDIVFQDPKWKITREGSSVPKYFIQGSVYQKAFWQEANTHISTTIQAFDATLIKALNYFYYESHNIQKWEDTNGIRVIANNDSNSSYRGLFSYNSMGACYITIYRHNVSNTNLLSGTIFHELGHFVHYKERGGTFAAFNKTDRLLQESFANYVGWYLVEKQYSELGYVKTHPGDDVSGQGYQASWTSATAGEWGYYSPLFVDLVDNFNQADYFGAKYNDDRLKGLHHSAIKEIASGCADWSSLKDVLAKNFTAAELGTFLAPYEAWYAAKNK